MRANAGIDWTRAYWRPGLSPSERADAMLAEKHRGTKHRNKKPLHGGHHDRGQKNGNTKDLRYHL